MESSENVSPTSLGDGKRVAEIESSTDNEALSTESIFGVDNLAENESDKFEKAQVFIKQEIIKSDIGLENCRLVADEILEKLKETELYSLEAEKSLLSFIEIKISALSAKFREDMKKYPEHSNEIYEMDKRSSSWMDDIAQYIIDNRDNPSKIDDFWKTYDEIYSSCSEVSKHQAESRKYGILAQVAAMDLVKDMAKEIKDQSGLDVKISIDLSTPEEDVKDKVDFWAIVQYHEKTKQIPCQVKSLDLRGGDERGKERFVSQNIVSFAKRRVRDANFSHLEEKMEEFFKKHAEGLFIILPRYKDKTITQQGGVSEKVASVFSKRVIESDDLFLKTFVDFYSEE
jgi:hypothetical protein